MGMLYESLPINAEISLHCCDSGGTCIEIGRFWFLAMLFKTLIFGSDTMSTIFAFANNFTLLYLIQTKTTEDLRPYSKILRMNSFVDMFFAFAISLTYFNLDINGEYIIINGGPLRHIPQPWNGYLLLVYIFALYFCVSSTAIPSFYRYILFVRNTQFYLLYVLTGVLSLGVSVWLGNAVLPSVYDNNIAREFYYAILRDDFWLEDDGSLPIFAASHLYNPFMIGTLIHALTLISVAYGFILFFTIKTWKHLNKFKSEMSERSRKLHKQLNYALVTQALTPLVVGALPLGMCIISLLFNISMPKLGVILITMVSWVAVLNPLCVIVFVGPYRDAILCGKKNKTTVASQGHSSRWGLSSNNSPTALGPA